MSPIRSRGFGSRSCFTAMSEGSSHTKLVAAGIAAAFLAFAGLSAWWLYETKREYAEQSQAEHNAGDAGSNGNAICLPLAGVHVCRFQRPTSETEEQLSRNDLQAQQDMATWALGVFLVSVGTLSATLIGVVLLWLTLRATRAAVSHAAAANRGFVTHSQTELRPYVSVDSLSFEYLHDPSDPNKIIQYRLNLIWKNAGQTPARKVRGQINAALFATGVTPEEFDFPDYSAASHTRPIGPNQTISTRTVIPVDWFSDAYVGKADLFYWGWVEYDGFGQRHRTEICSQIMIHADPADKNAYQFMRDAFRTAFNSSDEDCVHQSKT